MLPDRNYHIPFFELFLFFLRLITAYLLGLIRLFLTSLVFPVLRLPLKPDAWNSILYSSIPVSIEALIQENQKFLYQKNTVLNRLTLSLVSVFHPLLQNKDPDTLFL